MGVQQIIQALKCELDEVQLKQNVTKMNVNNIFNDLYFTKKIAKHRFLFII